MLWESQGQIGTRIINHLLPHPARFQQHGKQGSKHDLYVWRPIPEDPRRFVAMGHVATDTDEEPALERMFAKV